VTDLPSPGPDCAGCAARDEQIAELRERLARLERIVSRNSGNSPVPPSADDVPGRKPPSRQQRRAAERAARKRGKQPGAPGAAMAWAGPDEVKDHYPAGACGCGADLAAAADLGVARSYQQLEIPDPAARRVQHDLHAARCGCGREHVAERPPGVPDSPVSIGPDLRALALYLLVFQHVPAERCRQLIEDAAGAPVPAGFIHGCLARAADVISDTVKLSKTLSTAAAVAGFDETTLRAGPAGARRYVPGAFTERYSALFLGERTLASFRDFGILPDFAGVVVSGRYQNYFHNG
jgi:transposase